MSEPEFELEISSTLDRPDNHRE